MTLGVNTISKFQCECDLYDGHQCSLSARYEIDGIKFCTHHAGPAAIVKLLAAGEASRLNVVNKSAPDPLCKLTTIYDYHRDNNIKWR